MDKSKFNGWHSLSYEAMNEIMDDLWHTSKEQHTLFLDHKLIENNYKIYQGMTNIPTDFIDDEIFNPIARRSIRQAINIVNAIRKQYGEMDKIIIEMAREISVDPKEIMKEQKRNIESKKEAALLASPFGYTLESIPGQLLLMLRLWREQDGRCIYSNKAISIDDLINRHDLFQVDHIIPKSISFDDGYNNKVLCYSSENQNKGNKISSRYFASGKASISYDEYKNNVNNLFERGLISNKKKELLLFDKDINKYEVRQGFINRNLVDTRYSTKLVLNILQDYMVANKIKTSIFTVKGAYTHHIREKWNLPKDRLYYKHHVVDALIIAASDYNRFYKNNSFYNVIKEIGNNSFDKEFLMMYDNDEYDKIVYSEPFPHFIRDLKDLEPRISHKIDTKVNRGISNQTIYSSRLIDGEEYQISKYSNIYDSDGERLKKAIIENPEKLLLYYGDKEHHTFNELKRIVDNYPNSKNPFSEYYKEHGKIRRYSKNGNGPYITSVKYIDRKLGNHLSIAHKYPNSKRNVFLLSINSYRMDVYQDINGNYKFISITGIMFKYTKNGYILDNNKVEEEKIKKHITPSDIFCFSLYKGDVFEITTNDQTFKYVFLSVNSDDRNVIECNYVERQRNSGERKRVTIGKDVTNIKKYYTDILGHVYNSKQKELTTNR